MIILNAKKGADVQYVWFPEVGEKVKIRKSFLPKKINHLSMPIYAEIIKINGQNLYIKIEGEDVKGKLKFFRNQLKPIGNFHSNK